MPLFRRAGRPGLLGAAARTAVVAGTATATVGAIQRRQDGLYEQSYQKQQLEEARLQEEADAAAVRAARPPASSPSSTTDSLLSELERLGQLHASGILTDAEFASAKATILSGTQA